ncbi:MAG: hypothetical protein A2W05_09905 [Candidatus Schekmanbacteria bacterium RBG_16_38_10]|uniref:Uncharacterized protein n=1 Tax=Candidatus Schekmanbacteria bacterium RBG_16_38_10 TaxID=1817879 RepID=A0A1F7S1Y1_9BACT|nr:MAG: hypothetical protein A2W05_09905 [Candidatus Schekmanbacteria bacterium RBG_16_38_10]
MIKNASILKKLEDDFSRQEGRLPYSKSLKIFEYMWKEAINLKIWPPENPMEGIDVDIRIAKILNSCLKKSSQG